MLLLAAGLVGVVAALIAFLMIRQRPGSAVGNAPALALAGGLESARSPITKGRVIGGDHTNEAIAGSPYPS